VTGWAGVSRLSTALRSGLRRLTPARRRRRETVLNSLELIARIGYGARGFVYLSGGALTLLAIPGLVDGAAGTRGAIGWLALQPLGRAWVLLLARRGGRQPGGAVLLAAAAVGFIGFGLFSFIEARFRRIRPPREIVPI
jgi:hypothetical protein